MGHPPPPVTHHWDGQRWTCSCCGHTSSQPCDCPCCERRSDGVLVVSTPAVAIGLQVHDGIVIGAPAGGRGWLGRPVNRPLAAAWHAQPGVNLTWLPDLSRYPIGAG